MSYLVSRPLYLFNETFEIFLSNRICHWRFIQTFIQLFPFASVILYFEADLRHSNFAVLFSKVKMISNWFFLKLVNLLANQILSYLLSKSTSKLCQNQRKLSTRDESSNYPISNFAWFDIIFSYKSMTLVSSRHLNQCIVTFQRYPSTYI